MISSNKFIDYLLSNNLKFYSGVPDSLTIKICSEIEKLAGAPNSPIIFLPAAHEGIAIAFAIGHFLATGKPGIVFMQNAGIGNIYNPVVSLASNEVFGIPLILIVGWRGEPGQRDEPQHILQGSLTWKHLEDLGFLIQHIDKSTTIENIENTRILDLAFHNKSKIAFLFSAGSIE